MKILHLESYNYSESSLQKIRELGVLTTSDIKDEAGLIKHLSENKYDVIFTTLGYFLGEKMLSNQKVLKYIVTPTTGLNHIDLEYAKKRGIEVISLKGESEFLQNVKSTAEHTWALLLGLVRQIAKASAHTAKGNWNRQSLMCDELNTKTLGIIGYGRLGKIISQYAKAFGMQILVYDRNAARKDEAGKAGLQVVEMNSLLQQADMVLLMVSYNPENENMIGEKEFDTMKEGVYFVNTARGEMVDETALLRALQSGKIKGAALDVLKNDSSWKNEVPSPHPLIDYAASHSNLIITPHIGGYGKVSIHLTREFITEKFLKRIQK